MDKKIVVVSDFNLKGSGYLNIIAPLCVGLSNSGYDIKAVGWDMRGMSITFHLPLFHVGDLLMPMPW